jgi:hypothetical protein
MLASVTVTNIVMDMVLSSLACTHRIFRGTCCSPRIYLAVSVFRLIVFGADKRDNSFVCSFGTYMDWLIKLGEICAFC